MTIELFKNQKHVFWTALLLTIFIFSAGILLGFLIENWRTSKIASLYQQSELDLLDIRIQNDIYSLSEIDCTKVIEENINFADRVFEDAKLLEKYSESSRLSNSIILQHKKYDLLRTSFWINSIKLKERCKTDYHNVVYIYDYQNPSLETEVKQDVFSKLLQELKDKKGNKIMLIPIAGDNNLVSVDTLMNTYGIEEEELPIILIDEKIKITNVENIEEIEKYLD